MSSWSELLLALTDECGSWCDWSFGIAALLTALLFFFAMVMRHPFDILLVARTCMSAGYALVFYNAFTPGWLKPAVYLLVIGGLSTAILLATGWCERKDKSLTVGKVIWQWIKGPQPRALITWLAGPKKHPWDYPIDLRREGD